MSENTRTIERSAHELRYKLIIEAARELRKSERWLRDWLKQNPFDQRGEPFYRLAGRTKPSSRRKLGARQITISAAPTSESLLTEARVLLKSA